MKNAPETRKDAIALREIPCGLVFAQDENGHDIPIYLGGGKLNGDSIAFFTDLDGEVKTVKSIRLTINGPDEWIKVAI